MTASSVTKARYLYTMGTDNCSAQECDDPLAQQLRDGHDRAFDEFRDRYAVSFYHYFRRRGLSDADAQDLTADCLTDIPLKVRDHFDPGHTSFPAWINLLRQRAATDWWRRQRLKVTELEQDVAAPSEEDIEADVTALDAVSEGIKSLDPLDQELLLLRYRGQIQPTFAEIADELSRTHRCEFKEATLRQRHGRALGTLEALLRHDPRLMRILRRV